MSIVIVLGERYLLGHQAPAFFDPFFQEKNLLAGTREVGGNCQTVGASANHDEIKFFGHPILQLHKV
ncbi:protein of unknown function [Sterolibacterium denitrificans]|uniref:Uncharacterized protein n=1 Tax=Sterolibacterium denitrificans TaxID=157592 RepID=A0A7Z7MVC8_9PROT|nr:protein of unknown function [Sterolibacterium denitrificans]